MQIRDRIKELRRVPAKELIPNPKNWRKHPKHQADALRGILAEIGYAGALLARETPAGLQLIDGHLRAETTPDNDVPVLVLDVNEEEADKILATYDPLSGMATADDDQLKKLLQSIQTESDDVKKLLEKVARDERIDMEDPNAPGDGGDEFDNSPKNDQTRVSTGDLWGLGNHRILCGDSTNADHIARLLDGEKAALLSTDPPYCVDYAGKDRTIHDGKASGKDCKDWSHVYREVDDLGEFLDAVFKAALPHVVDEAAIYVWHAHLQDQVIAQTFEKHGLLLHQSLIWVKPSATFGHSYYRWRHEPCAFGWKRGHKPKHGYGHMDSVWEVDWEGKARIVGNEHPTQKPLKLFEIPMTQHTQPGDIVLEPFSGSGSQLIAAERNNRKCRAMEISPAFVEVAIRRWEAETGKQAEKL